MSERAPRQARGQRSRTPRQTWHGHLYLWAGRGLYIGPAFETAAHAHHAVQVCFALDGFFRLRPAPPARWKRFEAAVVASDQIHQLDGGGQVLALLYLDPETAPARALTPAPTGIRTVPPAGLRAPLSALVRYSASGGAEPQLVRVCEEILDQIGPAERPSGLLDARIAQAVDHLRTDPDRRVSLATIAKRVALSPGRFGHLFREQVGIPVRRYLLWLRLADALRAIERGKSLTETAHATGFADSAHMSRTCRRMLGVSPSALLER